MKPIKNLKILLVFLTMMILFTGCQTAEKEIAEYKYYSQEQLKNTLENDASVVILDVQVEEDFDAHHIEEAIATYAFPVKSTEDKAKIDAQLQSLEETDKDIVIVCPKGRIGAERTFDYLVEKGIASERLFILEGGQAEWTSSSNASENIEVTGDAPETDSAVDT